MSWLLPKGPIPVRKLKKTKMKILSAIGQKKNTFQNHDLEESHFHFSIQELQKPHWFYDFGAQIENERQ